MNTDSASALGLLFGGLVFAVCSFLFEAVIVMFAIKGLFNPEVIASVFGTFGFGKALLLTLILKIIGGVVKYSAKA